MDVILLERIAKLGNLGDVVHVKPGYARNYLLPQRKALRATKENQAYFEREKAALEAANEAQRSEAGEVSTALDGQFLVLIRQAGESGQLYGSVTARDIAAAATDKGVCGHPPAGGDRPADQGTWSARHRSSPAP